jgi:predicted DNA-binding protein
MSNAPYGYKQVNIVLPNKTIEKLDLICKQENRKRNAQIKDWIEKYKLVGEKE